MVARPQDAAGAPAEPDGRVHPVYQIDDPALARQELQPAVPRAIPGAGHDGVRADGESCVRRDGRRSARDAGVPGSRPSRAVLPPVVPLAPKEPRAGRDGRSVPLRRELRGASVRPRFFLRLRGRGLIGLLVAQSADYSARTACADDEPKRCVQGSGDHRSPSDPGADVRYQLYELRHCAARQPSHRTCSHSIYSTLSLLSFSYSACHNPSVLSHSCRGIVAAECW